MKVWTGAGDRNSESAETAASEQVAIDSVWRCRYGGIRVGGKGYCWVPPIRWHPSWWQCVECLAQQLQGQYDSRDFGRWEIHLKNTFVLLREYGTSLS